MSWRVNEEVSAYEDIRRLVAAYAVAIDSRDLDALVDLFVPDVRVGEQTGRTALRAFFDTQLRDIGVSILSVGTHLIDLTDDDHGTGVVYCRAEIEHGSRWIHQAIAYTDSYERRDGRWLFVRRKHELFYGVAAPTNPMTLPPANWPANPDGRGTLPQRWDSWQRFWAEP